VWQTDTHLVLVNIWVTCRHYTGWKKRHLPCKCSAQWDRVISNQHSEREREIMSAYRSEWTTCRATYSISNELGDTSLDSYQRRPARLPSRPPHHNPATPSSGTPVSQCDLQLAYRTDEWTGTGCTYRHRLDASSGDHNEERASKHATDTKQCEATTDWPLRQRLSFKHAATRACSTAPAAAAAAAASGSSEHAEWVGEWTGRRRAAALWRLQ